MPKYEFTEAGISLELPDEFLTVEQVEKGYRALIAKGADSLDLADPASGRILLQALLGDDTPDLAKLPATPKTMTMLFDMYNHVGTLFSKSMVVGDEVIQEVEEKKEEASVKPPAKKRGRPRSKSR